MNNADQIRALRERNAADRAKFAAEIEEREAEFAADPIRENDRILAEPSPLVRPDASPGDIVHRRQENARAAAAEPAAEEMTWEEFAAADPRLAGLLEGCIELVHDEKYARRHAVEKLRAELNTVAAKVDTLIAMLGAERAKSAEVIALPPWPKRDAS